MDKGAGRSGMREDSADCGGVPESCRLTGFPSAVNSRDLMRSYVEMSDVRDKDPSIPSMRELTRPNVR